MSSQVGVVAQVQTAARAQAATSVSVPMFQSVAIVEEGAKIDDIIRPTRQRSLAHSVAPKPEESEAVKEKGSSKVELHELPISANSLGCMMLCKDSALPVEFINSMGKTRTEEFMSFNPMHCCPTVKDGDFAV